MNNNILEIWSSIEQSSEVGLLKRLYTNDSELYIYAIFQNHGYKGLYGGLDNRDIQKEKVCQEIRTY
jgi:hypothetical protein